MCMNGSYDMHAYIGDSNLPQCITQQLKVAILEQHSNNVVPARLQMSTYVVDLCIYVYSIIQKCKPSHWLYYLIYALKQHRRQFAIEYIRNADAITTHATSVYSSHPLTRNNVQSRPARTTDSARYIVQRYIKPQHDRTHAVQNIYRPDTMCDNAPLGTVRALITEDIYHLDNLDTSMKRICIRVNTEYPCLNDCHSPFAQHTPKLYVRIRTLRRGRARAPAVCVRFSN